VSRIVVVGLRSGKVLVECATFAEARKERDAIGRSGLPCRAVRLLSPAESRRKAAATALRELADEMQADSTRKGLPASAVGAISGWAIVIESRADALWPRKGAGR
jgi:hypothetical protein